VREKGSFAGRWYSPHRLQSKGGIHITPRDLMELEHVADKNHFPRGLTCAQVERSGQETTI